MRVTTQKKANRGAALKCGRCGVAIEPGQEYRKWSFFRQRRPNVRCMKTSCAPRRSELTRSKMSEVFSAIETAEADVAEAVEVEDVADVISNAQAEVEAVADEYREAADAMGEAGYENEERADEVQEFADELAAFDPEEDLASAREEAQALLAECAL